MSDKLQPREVSIVEVVENALRIMSWDDLNSISAIPQRNLLAMIRRRLQKDGPPPTDDELEGIKELALEHLWHSAFERLPAGDSAASADTMAKESPVGSQDLEHAPSYLAWMAAIAMRHQ